MFVDVKLDAPSSDDVEGLFAKTFDLDLRHDKLDTEHLTPGRFDRLWLKATI